MHVILCNWTQGGKPKRKETWLWNEVDSTIKEKRRRIFGDLKSNDQRNQIFKEARRMKNENQDIVGEHQG